MSCTCKHCGKLFKPVSEMGRKAVYCSRTCKNDYYTGTSVDRENQACAWCGVGYSYHRKKKYCSDDCRHDASAYSSMMNRKNAIKARSVVRCHECGHTYVSTRPGASKFCSGSCSSKHYRKKTRVNQCRHCGNDVPFVGGLGSGHKYCSEECVGAARVVREWSRKITTWSPCSICGRLHTRHSASNSCGHSICELIVAARALKKPAVIKCESCGSNMRVVGRGRRRKRCKSCAKNYHRSLRKHILRAKHYGCAYEHVDKQRVFERDGYKCQRCGTKTRQDYDACHDKHPELDHIIPLSRGGPHAWHNVQCLCRRCNMEKSDDIGGDQMLIKWGKPPTPHRNTYSFSS